MQSWIKKILMFVGIGIVVVGLAYGALLGYLFYWPSVQDYIQRRPFNSDTWKQAENLKTPVRIYMVNDLLQHKISIGMSKTQIDALLGTPPATSYFKEYDYVYWLGPERGPFGIDSEWLVIKFKNGEAAEIKIMRD